MSMQGKSLHIMTPMYGGMSTGNYLQSFSRLILMMQQYQIPFSYSFTFNESLINRARNRLCDSYLKESTHTHCVFIDADIGFEPEEVLSLLEADRDIVGAGCVKKSIRWDRIQKAIIKSQNNGKREFTNEEMYKMSGDYVIIWDKFDGKREMSLGELQEVKNLGTGLLMIRRNVLEKFKEEYPDRWYEGRGDPAALPGPIHDFFRSGINPQTRDYDSEDYCFCNDCRAIGFKIWLAPWMRTTHMGTHVYTGDLPSVGALTGEL